MTGNVMVQMMLKCADIGHLSVDPKTHKRWALQLEEEFFRQVSSLCVLGSPSQHRMPNCPL